jgi:dUTPase
VVKKGEGIIQGIFIKYLTVDDENSEYEERKSNY